MKTEDLQKHSDTLLSIKKLGGVVALDRYQSTALKQELESEGITVRIVDYGFMENLKR